ncbi:MAG TPA: hypothetical protein VFZ98_09985 [Vicinamibacterales bacterium]
MKNVVNASAGERGGDSFETFCTAGGHGRFAGELCPPNPATAAQTAAQTTTGSAKYRTCSAVTF